MSLLTSTFYNVMCDRCREEYEDYDYTWTADENHAVERAVDSGWAEINGKHYCPNCIREKHDAEYDDEYIPLPDIPKEIWRGKEAMNFVTLKTGVASFKESRTAYYLTKSVGYEDHYDILDNADRTILRRVIGRDFDVDYIKGKSSAMGKQEMLVRLTIPKYGKEIIEDKED